MDILEDILNKSQSIYETKDFDSHNFKNKYIKKQKPVLLKGYANTWKAKNKWTFDFFAKLKFDKQVRIEIGNVIQNETNISRMSLKGYIDSITNSYIENNKNKPYLSMFNVFDYFPDLIKDTDLSIFTNHTKIDFPGVWIGPSGTISGLHYDSTDNVLTQIEGKKLVLLASKKIKKNMYPSKKFDNDSFGSRVDINNFKVDEFPDFKNVKFHKAILEPGDTLFIPKGWWHYVKSLEPSISVSNFGYSIKNVLTVFIKEQILFRLHMRGYYRAKDCTCHVMVDGKRILKGRI